MRISDWSSDVCSSDLCLRRRWRQSCPANRWESGRCCQMLQLPLRIREPVLEYFTRIDGEIRIAQDRRSAAATRCCIIHGRRHQGIDRRNGRSEEHTSELQSLMRNSYAVLCLKNKNKID